MNNLFNRLVYICAVFLMLMPLVSCGGGGDGAGTGTLELGLTDASTDKYQAIYVTIAEVQVKKQGEGDGEAGWETVVQPEQTYNLLDLVNGVIATLGVGELEAGQYGQMRLILGELPETPETNILGTKHPFANYLIDLADNEIEIKVPSGYQTGIKIVHGFTIIASGATELILDFDALRSIVEKGNGTFSLKPTIKILETVENSVGGIIDDGTAVVEGALVSAQIYTPTPDPADGWDPKDEVEQVGGTVSDENGAYFMYLPPNTYNIVVTKEGFNPACVQVIAEFYDAETADVTLSTVGATGTFAGSVTGLAITDGSAVFSIRREHDPCGMIEVATASVANTVTPPPLVYFDSITLPVLPVGITYEVVVSSEGETTQVFDVEVTDGGDAVLDVDFTPPPAP